MLGRPESRLGRRVPRLGLGVPKLGPRVPMLGPWEPRLSQCWIPAALGGVLSPLGVVHEFWMRLAEEVTQGVKSPKTNNNNRTLQKTLPLKRLVQIVVKNTFAIEGAFKES